MSGFAPLTDTTTGRSSKWDATNSAAHVNLSTLISGENQTLNALATYPAASEYQEGSAATDAGSITLGAVGAAGDFLGTVTIRLAAVGGTCTTSIIDGSTTLDSLTVVAQADNTKVEIPVNRQSKNGAWKISCDISAGTIANVKYGATGLFS